MVTDRSRIQIRTYSPYYFSKPIVAYSDNFNRNLEPHLLQMAEHKSAASAAPSVPIKPRTVRVDVDLTCCDENHPKFATYAQCEPIVVHTHDAWRYSMSAWSLQKSGHWGTGGDCLGSDGSDEWKDVVAFYNKHKNADYCKIVAHRLLWHDTSTEEYTCKCGTSQYVTLYVHCVGCGAIGDALVDWVKRGEPSSACVGDGLLPALKATV